MTGEVAVANPIATAVAATFDALVLRADEPVVVEFMSYGCSHCRALEPVLRTVAETLGSGERIVRVNVAVEFDLAAAYRIRVTPTLVMFRDGREVGRAEGPRPLVASLTAIVTRAFTAGDASR